MTNPRVWSIILKAITKHVIRRWYIYTTFAILFFAPLPVVLITGLGWLGFVTYHALTLSKQSNTL